MLASQGGKLDSLSHWANLFLLKWRDVTTREVVLGAHKVPFKKINTEFNQRSEISYYCTTQMSNQHLLNQYLFAKMQHFLKNTKKLILKTQIFSQVALWPLTLCVNTRDILEPPHTHEGHKRRNRVDWLSFNISKNTIESLHHQSEIFISIITQKLHCSLKMLWL